MLTDIATYVSDPIGKTCGSAQFFVWFPSPQLRIIATWGTMALSGADFILHAVDCELAPDFPPHCSLIDLRGVRPVAHDVINRFLNSGIANLPGWQRVIRSSAIVHDGGVAGMAAGAIAGYTAHSRFPIHVHMHEEIGAALRALPPLDLDPTAIEEGIALRRTFMEEAGSVVRTVRAWIAENLRDASMATCAKAMGTASRTLQRRLLDADSTFRQELQRERVARAQTLLAETDLKVAAIADEVGYPKLQSLADAFRRETGLTPAAWRERHR